MAHSDLLPISEGPRVIVYHQTHHGPNNGPPVSLLPLITNGTGVTHIIVAAFHLNDEPGDITLNDQPPNHEKFNTLWAEVSWLQATGIKVLGMLGGAAKGTYARLDGSNKDKFERFYTPLRDIVRRHNLNGLDLDVEEEMSFDGIVRLIDRLRSDFGPEFLITLAPVATALLPDQRHLSGFNYTQLESLRSHEIAWYNTQFYCGWGDASSTFWYDAIMASGWKSNKVVVGLITNPSLGAGFVDWDKLKQVLLALRLKYPDFGGVMGWEYFCARPGGEDRPWEWVAQMSGAIRTSQPLLAPLEDLNSSQRATAGGSGFGLPNPQHLFPDVKVKALGELGFNLQQSVAALNITNGNVEQAAQLLLDE